MPGERGAPHGGAALLRRTSVFAWGENLGAGGIHFRRAFEIPEGGAALWAAEPKKKDTTYVVSFFLVDSNPSNPNPLSEEGETRYVLFLQEVRLYAVVIRKPSGSSQTVTEFTIRSMIILLNPSSSRLPPLNFSSQNMICSRSIRHTYFSSSSNRRRIFFLSFSSSTRRSIRESEAIPFSMAFVMLAIPLSISFFRSVSSGIRVFSFKS